SWSVEDSEEVRARLEEADRLLSRGLPDRAAPLFQQVLDRFPDHLVRDPEDGNRFDGARALVLRRLRALPPDARKAYDAHAGPLGEALLERALRALDPDLLRECGERFVLAGDAGPRALLALADLRLARGEPGPAASALRTLLRESAGTRWAGPAAAARLARALGATGDREGILALRRAREGELDANLREGEASATLRSVIDAALAAAGPPPRPGDVPMLGGAPDRRGVGLPPEALDRVRWVHRNHDRFRWTERDRDQRQNEPSVANALDASQPVAAALWDGVLFVHHHYHVIARDLYTGTERWRFERYHPHVDRGETARTHGSLIFAPAVAGGLVYAPLQVWPLGDTPLIQRFAGQEIIPHIPVRRLFALDAASGRQVWTHADPRPGADAFAGPLRTLNVTSSPLVIGDEVFAAGASYAGGFTAWAFAADRRTGAVRWTARLGYGQQELNLFGRTVKEVPVAALASDGERLFVQTNMGFVSCLDLATGRPVWSRGYAQSPVPLYQNLWTTPERELTWTGSPPVAAGGLVLAAP
ncbi:MAG TPA: PQQ-binding-like beta-propeller repeat protein, partial [Planctomycetota bacterium]|nr:PQQ-binding-like beta-propeller repeat protein [Planctomycetota bacterium]